MVSVLSGGSLFLTTVVLLCFYIGHYVDTHKKQLGILKALGYSRIAIAKGFAVFGLSVFVGTFADKGNGECKGGAGKKGDGHVFFDGTAKKQRPAAQVSGMCHSFDCHNVCH